MLDEWDLLAIAIEERRLSSSERQWRLVATVVALVLHDLTPES